MPRPKQCRRVGLQPGCTYFKPAGVPGRELQEVVLTVDELESLRLADLEGHYHEQAAEQMGVSRRTFGRIIQTARNKVAQALIHGKALRIEGGVVEMQGMRTFCCHDCSQNWEFAFGTGKPECCPHCKSVNIKRTGTSTDPPVVPLSGPNQ